MKNLYRSIFRLVFRFTNSILNRFGILISKPEVIHGSPAFSGAVTQSRKSFIFKTFYDLIIEIEGDVIEAGIHWGYGLLSHLLFTTDPYIKRKIYAFDSFNGHSKATEKDKSSGKWINLSNTFAITKDDVYKTMLNGTEYSLDELNNRIKIFSGWAQETMPSFSESKQIAFVHSDMDIYEPISTTLKSFWPILTIGGIISIGKLNNPELMGKTLAFNEFISTLPSDTYHIGNIKIKEINTLNSIELTYIKKIK